LKHFHLKQIQNIAQKHGCVTGRWVAYIDGFSVDDVWNVVAQATNIGMLGRVSRVSACDKHRQQFVICIFTEDFTDKQDVARVLRALKEKIPSMRDMRYRPNFYDLINLRRGNIWKIPTTIYTSKDFVSLYK
jgi:hypothetical protein